MRRTSSVPRAGDADGWLVSRFSRRLAVVMDQGLRAVETLLFVLFIVGCAKPRDEGASTTTASASVSGSSSTGVGASVPTPPRITGAQARDLVGRGALLVDVRSRAEFVLDGLPGALHVPHDQVQARAAEFGAKDRPLVLYCHSGRRSKIAAVTLAGLGFTSVYDMGPRDAW